MPGAPSLETIDMVAPHFTALGIPTEVAASVWQALDAAGLTVVTKTAGAPVSVADSTPGERVQIAGCPGHFLVAAKVGERGWYAWVEIHAPGGAVTRLAPVFTAGGAGDLLLKPQTTGRWTVGTTDVASTDSIS